MASIFHTPLNLLVLDAKNRAFLKDAQKMHSTQVCYLLVL